MGLFWKRTKKQESEQPANEQAVEQTSTEQALEASASVELESQHPQPEQKAGFFKRLFGKTEAQEQEAEPIVRAPEQEKKSFWERWGRSEENAATPASEPEVATTSVARADAEKMSLFKRWKASLNRTSENLMSRLDDVIHGKKVIDAEVLDHLEEALIGADIGVQTAMEIIENARKKVDRSEVSNFDELKRLVKDNLLDILNDTSGKGISSEVDVSLDIQPYVMMIVGVNGVGKTTTIGKLANRIKAEGNEVLICAADTFRAAASDQLAIWAERTGVPLIQQKKGTDPAAVVFDSLAAAKARKADVLIIDTAGRLHNKANLMAELEKMKRIAGREVQSAPHEVLLVVDAVTGQNGLEQARQFLKAVPVTGIVLTKLDGTAKGGIVVAIAKELRIPIRYVGIGERMDDLVEFSPEDYVNSLFD
ncbi:MAG: signal recognition particle-docking protein FtsY [Blastocatellia bacterium]|nr:signal recognition particle-docking protein FtsY [Blastocatellia bacterium]